MQISGDVPSETTSVSVSEEIRRFQKEINSVAVENSKFFKWKLQRHPTKSNSSSSSPIAKRNVISNQVKHASDNFNNFDLEPENEITVLGIPDEVPEHLSVRIRYD